MGTASKVVSVLLRTGELICGVVCIGLIGYFLYVLDLGNGPVDGRLVYGIVVASLSTLFSIILFPPIKYSFYCFPIDIVLFICSIVAFGLLADLTDGHTCSAFWYWNYWGYYWGRFWVTGPRTVITAVDIDRVGCGAWRCTLAFMFMGGFAFLMSGFLGIYAVTEIYHRTDRIKPTIDVYRDKLLRKRSRDAETPPVQTTGAVSNGPPLPGHSPK